MSYVKWLIEFKESPDADVGWVKDIDTSRGEIEMTRNAFKALHFETKEEAERILSLPAFGPWEHLLSRLYVCDHQFITETHNKM
jgi:hypothetical protein